MGKLINTFTILTLFISCTINSFQVESKFENGNNKIIYRSLSDTTIYGKTYNRKFKIKFNENKDTLRKGIYINNMALGDHSFYRNNKLDCIRSYIIPNPFFIDIGKQNETVDFSPFEIRTDSTYLNTAIYFDQNGDSLIQKSHLYKTKFHKNNWNINDSLKVDFEFYYPGYEVVKSTLYFIVPQDSSMITMAINRGREYTLKRKIFNKNHDEIKGLAEIIVFDKTKKAGDTNAYSKSLVFINEQIVVQ
ncbi:hypothetical protein [Gramella sp. MAR_2010_147]|uniref:hypothetical protein n=1 Tax=Gramella sp. MAR_2010_147 TaxID=1250205 RepID=UPI00087C49A8|nr:hypothetical protein [Gramella sp. MAR_2010_147]SDR91278.1 hypothetical protein SAMN04488553_1014 [Gramella sp. MAR_2010_147]